MQTAALKGENLVKKGEELATHGIHFKKSAEDLVQFRAQIEKKGRLLDNIFNEIRDILTPEQTAKVILFVEKYQFKKEIALFTEEGNGEEWPQKRLKLDE